MFDFEGFVGALGRAQADFIIVGGAAGTVHGAARLTQDFDVVYARNRTNVEKVVAALAPYKPYPRGAPDGLPFQWDAITLEHGTNFTLTTQLGDIDLLGEIVGGRTYEELLPHSIIVTLYGVECRCLELEKLIAVKRAAGRPKDFEAIAELETILKERGSSSR